LLARERDVGALTYLATLLRRPEIRLFPGEDELKVHEQPALLDAIRGFVGIEAPAPELDTVLSTVLFTDVVDSTRKQAELGDRRYKALIEQHHAIVRDGLDRYRGQEASTAGDGFYATFEGPARAIRCALEIEHRVRDLGIEVRAGVHTGECELIDGQVGGLTVSIGARVAARAGPNVVLVSQTVKDLVAGSGFSFDDAGEHELKGVPDRWRLYRVVA
jgi:class 3 adenylate cyclase